MKFRWFRNSLPGLTLLLLIGFMAPSSVLGNQGLLATSYAPVVGTAYAVPTSYVVPTSYYETSYVYPTAAYVYPTAYVAPTAYVVPTAYTAASYAVAPTSYLVPTTYYRRSFLFPRRWVARTAYTPAYSYAPTAYYTPTVYTPTVYATSYVPTVVDYPVVASSSTVCCGGETMVASAPSVVSGAPRMTPRAENGERPPSSAVESVPSNVTPPPAEAPSSAGATPPPPQAELPANERPAPAAPEAGSQTPPIVPAPAPAPGGQKEENPPRPQSPSEGAADATGAPRQFRQSLRPVLSTPATKRPAGRAANILEGKVVSSETRQGEEGVRIIVSNRPGVFDDKIAVSDAYGHYAVRLPDGDWTVKVSMPSGRVYPVSQITISGGQIVDNFGREIPTLTITR